MAETESPEPDEETRSAPKPRRGVMGIEEFTSLASKLAGLGLYRDAINLYETATGLHPDNIALKINLARVRDMKRRADREALKELDTSIQARRTREDTLANHYLGLGYLHYRRGDISKARDFFEFSQTRNEKLFLAPLYLAKIAIGRNDTPKAIGYLQETRRNNPFSEEAASLLGRLYMEEREYELALNAFVDALVLSGDTELSEQPFYNRKLREILRQLGKSPKSDLPDVIHDRTQRFTAMAEKLDRRRREAQQEQASARLGSVFAAFSAKSQQRDSGSAELEALRSFEMLARLDDDDLAAIAERLERRELDTDEAAFAEGAKSDRLYLLEKGSAKIRKQTPFGEHILIQLDAPEIFGEMNFIDGKPHSADAVAQEPSVILTFSREDANELFADRRHIAVQFLSHFWKTLAQHIRDTNEQMKTFFVSEAMNAEKRFDEERLAEAEKVIVDINKKIALFKEKGLSGSDLQVLASLSSEERYSKEDLIFKEGDPGSRLYIVLEGGVRISKTIPGVGEEALAILESGDFFGEMALIDQKPRSADARAHEDRTTVISIDKQVLDDMLTADVESAQQFLTILCRILAQRLREINETIVKWRIMAGGF